MSPLKREQANNSPWSKIWVWKILAIKQIVLKKKDFFRMKQCNHKKITMICNVYKMPCLWNLMSIKCHVYGNCLFIKCRVYEICCIWNVMLVKCRVYDMSYPYNVMSMELRVYQVWCLWNVKFMKLSLHSLIVWGGGSLRSMSLLVKDIF